MLIWAYALSPLHLRFRNLQRASCFSLATLNNRRPLSELVHFSLSTFWNFELSCSALGIDTPLYPFFELRAPLFQQSLDLEALLLISLSSLLTHIQISFKLFFSLSFVVPFILWVTLIVASDGDWHPLFHFSQLSLLFKLCYSSFSYFNSLWPLLLLVMVIDTPSFLSSGYEFFYCWFLVLVRLLSPFSTFFGVQAL
jgi:hypothetical protein